MLTYHQAIIAAQTRACARLQPNERQERYINFRQLRKERNQIKAPAEKPAIPKNKASG